MPVKVDPVIVPLSNDDPFALKPSAVELPIDMLVATTLFIVPVYVLPLMTLSVIVESSIVELVRTTLLPVPSLNSDCVMTILLAVESVMTPAE